MNGVLSFTISLVFMITSLVQLSYCRVIKREIKEADTAGRLRVEDHDESHRWPHGIIPYEISDDLNDTIKSAIKGAVDEFHNRTCITWVPHSKEPNFISFVSGNKCHATIGRVGGKQEILMAEDCGSSKGTALHEMFHALGFGHEHNRPDRDLHVKILWDNIKPEQKEQFEKDVFAWAMDVKYDYGSIMHYGKNTFSKDPDNLDTIEPKNKSSGVQLGHSESLSKSDIAKLNEFYKCFNKTSLAPDVEPTCDYLNRHYNHSEEFIEDSYVMKCFAYLNGTRIVRPVACLQDDGTRQENGTKWLVDNAFMLSCQISYDSETQLALSQIIPVACVSEGKEFGVNETFVKKMGASSFSFLNRCTMDSSSINSVPIGCRYTSDNVTIDVDFDCYKKSGPMFVACVLTQPGSRVSASANSEKPADVKECSSRKA